MNAEARHGIDETDRRIILATQAGLPLSVTPYAQLAEQLELPPEEVMARLRRMLSEGMIRRIAAVPNHYRIGYGANGMSVWDIPDEAIERCGRQVGALEFVSHCYHRPRRMPHWPYNLFAMVHGRGAAEVHRKVAEIGALLGPLNRGHDVLFSTQILKKTSLRLAA